jgi:hypothetical protein
MKHGNENAHMQDCIDTCRECRDMCQKTFYTHCLEMGGKHVGREHAILMADCIATCQLAADLMQRNSPNHAITCRACADICEACADSCEAVGGEEMMKCAQTCRGCADGCRKMSQGRGMAGEGKEASGIMA